MQRGAAVIIDMSTPSRRSRRPRARWRVLTACFCTTATLQLALLGYHHQRLPDDATRILAAGSATASDRASDTPRTPAVGGVPQILHQSWKDDGFPKTIFNWRWQQGILDLNPGWRLQKWTDNTSRALIAADYAWFLPAYDAYPSYIQRCDASRYFIAHRFGGVYADLDIECRRPFAPTLAGARVALSYKKGTNISAGLVNAIFASEARHPFWVTVFELLVERAAAGAAATTHVEVVRSTGPGLLREAVEKLQVRGQLDALGVRLLPSRVWHPTMPEQKRGRGDAVASQRLINASVCHHHFVSSWVQHDRERHNVTDQRRRAASHSTTVPLGLAFRTSNEWRSFELNSSARSTAEATSEQDQGVT